MAALPHGRSETQREPHTRTFLFSNTHAYQQSETHGELFSGVFFVRVSWRGDCVAVYRAGPKASHEAIEKSLLLEVLLT